MCLSWGSNLGPQRSLRIVRVYRPKLSQNKKSNDIFSVNY